MFAIENYNMENNLLNEKIINLLFKSNQIINDRLKSQLARLEGLEPPTLHPKSDALSS